MNLVERLALSVPAPCVCVETPLCNQHKAIVAALRSALDEAITITLRMGHEDVAIAIEALKVAP